MDANEARLERMRDEWCELDEAMIVTFQTHLRVVAAWEALTRPEHLADLEFRFEYFDGGAAMNDWAAEVTRKAIEVSRARAAGPAQPIYCPNSQALDVDRG